jgi:hypothetical protein
MMPDSLSPSDIAQVAYEAVRAFQGVTSDYKMPSDPSWYAITPAERRPYIERVSLILCDVPQDGPDDQEGLLFQAVVRALN